jgi:hypothetical protein
MYNTLSKYFFKIKATFNCCKNSLWPVNTENAQFKSIAYIALQFLFLETFIIVLQLPIYVYCVIL